MSGFSGTATRPPSAVQAEEARLRRMVEASAGTGNRKFNKALQARLQGKDPQSAQARAAVLGAKTTNQRVRGLQRSLKAHTVDKGALYAGLDSLNGASLEARSAQIDAVRGQTRAFAAVVQAAGRDVGLTLPNLADPDLATLSNDVRAKIKDGAQKLSEDRALRTLVAQAVALSHPGAHPLGAVSGSVENPHLADLASRVPLWLVERVTGSRALAESPIRAALIQKAIAAEAIAMQARQAQAQKPSPEAEATAKAAENQSRSIMDRVLKEVVPEIAQDPMLEALTTALTTAIDPTTGIGLTLALAQASAPAQAATGNGP